MRSHQKKMVVELWGVFIADDVSINRRRPLLRLGRRRLR